jgi:hypothetical protein
VTLALATRQARLNAIRTNINSGGGGAVHLYAAPEVATPETAAAAPPLAIVALAADCGSVGATADLATLTLTPVIGNAALSGMVSWARFVNGAGAAVMDMPAGAPGSNKPVIVTDNKPTPSAVVYSGGEVQIASALWTE